MKTVIAITLTLVLLVIAAVLLLAYAMAGHNTICHGHWVSFWAGKSEVVYCARDRGSI